MKPQIHYVFKSMLSLKRISDGEFEFIEYTEAFNNDEPIIAREEALKFYHFYLSFFQNPKNWENKTDRQIREEVKKYFNPNEPSTISIDDEKFEIDSLYGNEIGVYMVWDNPNHKEFTMDDIENDYDESVISKKDYIKSLNSIHPNPETIIIHGIGGMAYPESLMIGLENEYDIYKDNNYKTDGYETTVVFCDSNEWLEGYRDDEPATYTILKTPYDWSGMDKPYWWGGPSEEDKQEGSSSITELIEAMIANGENHQVEFKPTLLYNFKTKKAAIGIKGIIAKTICGFLNANGGFLIIGVKDDGEIQGLSHDYSLAEDKNPKDYFALQFDDTIHQFLPISMKSHIISGFLTVKGKELFVAKVHPSKTKPVFMKGQHGKEFWVRWTASTRQYDDIEDITEYCINHWGNSNKTV